MMESFDNVTYDVQLMRVRRSLAMLISPIILDDTQFVIGVLQLTLAEYNPSIHF